MPANEPSTAWNWFWSVLASTPRRQLVAFLNSLLWLGGLWALFRGEPLLSVEAVKINHAGLILLAISIVVLIGTIVNVAHKEVRTAVDAANLGAAELSGLREKFEKVAVQNADFTRMKEKLESRIAGLAEGKTEQDEKLRCDGFRGFLMQAVAAGRSSVYDQEGKEPQTVCNEWCRKLAKVGRNARGSTLLLLMDLVSDHWSGTPLADLSHRCDALMRIAKNVPVTDVQEIFNPKEDKWEWKTL